MAALGRPVGEVVIGRGVETEAVDPEPLYQTERGLAEPVLPAFFGEVEGFGVDAGEPPRTVGAEPLRVLGREWVDLWGALGPVRSEIDDVLAPRPLQGSGGTRGSGKDVADRRRRGVKDPVLLDSGQSVADRAPV